MDVSQGKGVDWITGEEKHRTTWLAYLCGLDARSIGLGHLLVVGRHDYCCCWFLDTDAIRLEAVWVECSFWSEVFGLFGSGSVVDVVIKRA